MNQGIGYGHLPPRETNLVPWNEVCIDLISPWTIVVNGRILEFKDLTSIDPVTSIAERIESNRIESNRIESNRIKNRISKHVSEQTIGSQDVQDQIDVFMTTKENSLVMISKSY